MWQAVNESLSGLCSSAFWNTDLTWNSSDPVFTVCFEKTVLIWLPCLLLWLFLPWEINSLHRTNAYKIPFNRYNISKLVIIATSAAATLIDVVNSLFSSATLAFVDVCSPVVKFFTICLFLGLTYANIKCGIRSSGVLFSFSFALAICGAPEFLGVLKSTSHENSRYGNSESISYFIYYSSVLAVFLLNCFADTGPPVSEKLVDKKHVCPANESSVLSKLFFAWFDSFAWKGYRRPLTDDDLWNVNYDLKVEHVSKVFESKWNAALEKNKKDVTSNAGIYYKTQDPVKAETNEETTSVLNYVKSSKNVSIFFPLWRAFGWSLSVALWLNLLHGALSFANPLILKLILGFVGDKNDFLWHGYLYSVVLIIVGVLSTLIQNQFSYVAYFVGLQLRTALTSTIYKKLFRISNGARRDFTLGEIVNLISVDTERFYLASFPFTQLVVAPIQILAAVYFLWAKLGISVLAGLLVWCLIIPVNYVLVSYRHKVLGKSMKRKDERVKMISEVLSGIKVLKLNAWEPSFEKQITRIHEKEISIGKKMYYSDSIGWSVWSTAPFIVTLVTFAVYVLSDETNVLDAEVVFVSLSLFNVLRYCVSVIPGCLSYLTQTSISMKRINKFLNAEELDPSAVSHEERYHPITIENANFSWEGYQDTPVLTNINLKVKPESLVAVVGLVGSGKSSLLSAILGEMYKQSGIVNTRGSIAYVPQQAWIRNATLKENITFGETENHLEYAKIVEACALKEDLRILPGGDQTEIGEKGVNVSGGQKQRISIARAVYSNADSYLLDDPLSAVDAHVGKHIFEQVIGPDGLLKNKIRIFVTHNLSYLPQADSIIVLNDGAISSSGTYDELMKTDENFARIVATHEKKGTLKEDNDEVVEPPKSIKPLESGSGLVQNGPPKSTSVFEPESGTKPDEVDAKLIEEETTETGNIDAEVGSYYLKAMGWFLITIVLLLGIVYVFFLVVSNFWLTIWSGDKTTVVDVNKQYMYLGVYAFLGLCQALTCLLQSSMLFSGMMKAAKYIHKRLLVSVLHWPSTTFDKVPSGRIMNRFGSDIDVIQNSLPQNLWMILLNSASVIATLFAISYTTPVFILVIPFLGAIYYFLERFYTATSRQLKRLESNSKSPIYSQMSETVSGVASIRAQGLQSMFIIKLENKMDFSQKSSFANVVAERWLSQRLELTGTMISFFATLFAIFSRETLSAELVGWSVSFALQITLVLYVWIQMISQTETNVVAIERIKQYNDVEQEAEWEVAGENVPNEWPSKGEVVFEDLVARYRKGAEPVLRGISFSIKSGERIGIVGRTGAGKSSLTLSLFRLIEPESGRILIDGIDVTKIGLHTLRGRLTIIPQDPVLFSGTLRMNVDPTDKCSDDRIWEALEQANLKSFVSTLKFGLQSEVTEGGSNFSVGQRQLICLARAVLRKTKLLIMDEATAAVDVETDESIQMTIRKAFEDSTVLTIAHRLNTVLDYDRIIVLDKGHIAEFDTPSVLLDSEKSIFRQMASDAGLI